MLEVAGLTKEKLRTLVNEIDNLKEALQAKQKDIDYYKNLVKPENLDISTESKIKIFTPTTDSSNICSSRKSISFLETSFEDSLLCRNLNCSSKLRNLQAENEELLDKICRVDEERCVAKHSEKVILSELKQTKFKLGIVEQEKRELLTQLQNLAGKKNLASLKGLKLCKW
mgnify:FL=1